MLALSIAIVGPAKDTIRPAIDFTVTILTSKLKDTIPFSVNGVIRAEDGKVLSTIYAIDEQDADWIIKIQREGTTYNQDAIKFKCRVDLEENALEHIERLREKNRKHKVQLMFDINVIQLQASIGWSALSRRSITTANGEKVDTYIYDYEGAKSSNDSAKPITVRNEEYLQIQRRHIREEKEISDSDWIVDYLPVLQKMNYLLMEVPEIAPLNFVDDNLKEFASRLKASTDKLKSIQAKLREGEWDAVVRECRGVYEDLKKGFPFNNNLKELISRDTGIPSKNLNDLVIFLDKSFDYDEASHHYRTPEGDEIKLMIHKEDAYFSYLRLLGIVNMLNSKISRQPRKII